MASNTKKKSASNQKKKKEPNIIKDEIVILVALGIGILLTISNFGIGGFVGDAISSVLFGVFGLLAYVAPFLLFLGIAFLISNRGKSSVYIKLIAGVVLSLMICTFSQLVTNSYHKTTTLLAYYHASSLEKTGGGILGGGLVKLLCPAIGIIGTYVIVIVIAIICMILLTEKALLHGMKREGKKAYSSAKEDAKQRHAQADIKKEKKVQENQQKEMRRKDHPVSGVSYNTEIAKKSPNVQELKVPQEDEIIINRANPQNITEEKAMQTPSKNENFVTTPMGATSAVENEVIREVEQEVESVDKLIRMDTYNRKKSYKVPPLSLLTKGKKDSGDSDIHLRETAIKLQQTLQNFGVNVTVSNVSCGPSVTRYELQPEQGVKVSKIVGLADDIKLNLAAADIRIEAPIPGKAAVGIEVPNKENSAVMLRDLLETPEFKNHPSNIAFAAGRDLAGKVVVADIMKMPHVLIAGATGSGKSVCINTLIMSILYKAGPEDVKLIMIDPKVVELSVYNGIPHLMIPVVTDPKKAAGALNWAVAEMTKRYQLFAEYNVRDLKGYNEKIATIDEIEDENKPVRLPQLVIIVDELADLMMVAPGEVEGAICRLAQLARAAGIHLVLATQRPSVNVITGLIKANMPSRIAFSVSSGVDSRTIIDMNGAEKLLGKGDMLFYPAGYQKPARVQGSFVSDKEVQAVVEYLVNHNGNATYNEEVVNHVNQNIDSTSGNGQGTFGNQEERDMYFVEAGRFIIEKDKASIGMLQRVFKIGFNRAARIMDQLSEAGVVGEEEGTKPRKVLMSTEEFEQYIEECV
ncbi:MAG: DNA translocase FtsK 4TM domain-containing protein [Lachnospiraceae bacterium]